MTDRRPVKHARVVREKALDEYMAAQVEADAARVIAAHFWEEYKQAERDYRQALREAQRTDT